MTCPLLQSLPLLIHIHLNLSDLLFLQMSESSLFQEVLLDREMPRFMIEGVSSSIDHLVKGKDIRFHGKNGQFGGKI